MMFVDPVSSRYKEKITIPIKNFVLVSEEEDVEDLESRDYDKAILRLAEIRDLHSDKSWALVAEIDE